MPRYHVHAWSLQRMEEGIGSPWTEVIGGCKWCGYWKSSLGLLEEQPVLNPELSSLDIYYQYFVNIVYCSSLIQEWFALAPSCMCSFYKLMNQLIWNINGIKFNVYSWWLSTRECQVPGPIMCTYWKHIHKWIELKIMGSINFNVPKMSQNF